MFVTSLLLSRSMGKPWSKFSSLLLPTTTCLVHFHCAQGSASTLAVDLNQILPTRAFAPSHPYDSEAVADAEVLLPLLSHPPPRPPLPSSPNPPLTPPGTCKPTSM